jgi:aspartate/methionine/tyrosine aminotransferase
MTTENLTHIERLALHSPINLADGHARQSLHPATMSAVVERFNGLMSAPVDVTEIEGEFLDALTARSGVPYNRPRTWISYSASIAIDIVAKLLTRRGLRVGLVTPTFDNLSALIERNGTELVAVPEEWLTPTVDFDRLSSLGLTALFVVQPNNPTGTSWSQGTWQDVCTWAARNNILLVGDMSFRLFDPDMCWDQLQLAQRTGASLILIEDTGKIVPLHDTKVGVVTCTPDLEAELREIHEAVLLNVSSIDLALITVALGGARSGIDEIQRARELVRSNKQQVKAFAAAHGLTILSIGGLSVEWVDVGPMKSQIVSACVDRGLIVLPGEYFHWNELQDNRGTDRVRLALMRDDEVLRDGLTRFGEALSTLSTRSALLSPALS